MTKTLAWAPVAPDSGRRAIAKALRRASRLLARTAHALAPRAPVHRPTALETALAHETVEFHAEAGAAEGALYINGQLVGHLPGVPRL